MNKSKIAVAIGSAVGYLVGYSFCCAITAFLAGLPYYALRQNGVEEYVAALVALAISAFILYAYCLAHNWLSERSAQQFKELADMATKFSSMAEKLTAENELLRGALAKAAEQLGGNNEMLRDVLAKATKGKNEDSTHS